MHFKLPFIERVVKKVSLKEQVADFDPQPVITKMCIRDRSCTVLLDGYDYDYGAAYASQPLPAPDGTRPTDTYQVNGLTLLVYDDGAVGWYDMLASCNAG